MDRRCRIVIAAALVAALSACAGDDGAELATLRSEVEDRRDEQAAVEERVDELESTLESTQAALARTARDARVDELEADLLASTDTLDRVAEELAAATGAIDELGTRLDAETDELGGAIATVRRAVEDLEGETTMLADQLDALRQRVDVIQAR